MTRVLVITDNERVQKAFGIVGESGDLELRVSASLIQGDVDAAGFQPDVTFIQSRISGLSGEIMLRHLKKLLPPSGRVVLMGTEAEDAAQARKHHAGFLDVSLEEEALAESITALLEGEAGTPGKKGAAAEGAAAVKPRPARKKGAVEKGAASAKGELPPAAGRPERQEPEAGQGREEVAPEKSVVPAKEDFAPAVGAGDLQEPEAGPSRQEEERPPELPPEPRGRKEGAGAGREGYPPGISRGVASFEEMMRRAGEKEGPEPPQPLRLREALGEEPFRPETVTPVRKQRIIPLALLLLVLAPLLYYLLKPATAKRTATRPAARPVAPAPVAKPAPPTEPIAPTQAPPVAKPAPAPPAARPTVPPPRAAAPLPAAPAAKPAARQKGGLRALPPFLSGVNMDTLYGKKHPGWQRYIGARAEYRLFKEGDLFRAIQVLALPGQSIPDEIASKVFKEFGGIDTYLVQSTEKKQQYLIEHGLAAGNISVTIYRRINDRRIKGVVLAYH